MQALARAASAGRRASAPRSTASDPPHIERARARSARLLTACCDSATRPPPSSSAPTSCSSSRRSPSSCGFDSVFISDHFQPLATHTAGTRPFSLAWLGALGARTSRVLMGTSVLTPDLPLSSLDRRAGVRDARLPVSRAHDPRRRHRRVAQRGAGDRHAPGPSRRSARRASRKRCSLIRALWTRSA